MKDHQLWMTKYRMCIWKMEEIMSPFNKGESEKQDTLDPIWLERMNAKCAPEQRQFFCHCVHRSRAHKNCSESFKNKHVFLYNSIFSLDDFQVTPPPPAKINTERAVEKEVIQLFNWMTD